MNEEERHTFKVVELSLDKMTPLHKRALLLYLYLSKEYYNSFCQGGLKDNIISSDYLKLAEDFCCGKEQIRRNLKHLEKYGILKRIRKARNKVWIKINVPLFND